MSDRYWTDVVDRLEERELLDGVSDIARTYRVTMFEVCGRGRTQTVVKARHACWRYLRRDIGFSLTEIGKIWGVDHTSIVKALNKENGS